MSVFCIKSLLLLSVSVSAGAIGQGSFLLLWPFALDGRVTGFCFSQRLGSRLDNNVSLVAGEKILGVDPQ